MAADEVLLEAALAGVASFRLYGWAEPTVSLGYFQAHPLRHDHPQLAGLPFVRRPSGGGALVHHREITYALGLPAGPPWQTGGGWLGRMHTILAKALAGLGVAVSCCDREERVRFNGLLCFQHLTPGDLLIGGAKVVGSAQRRHRGALMQHGAILLAASPHAPELPGVAELSGRTLSPDDVGRAVVESLARATGGKVCPGEFTPGEKGRAQELVRTKYGHPAWNEKR
jgi:lipoate-protein ligase A